MLQASPLPNAGPAPSNERLEPLRFEIAGVRVEVRRPSAAAEDLARRWGRFRANGPARTDLVVDVEARDGWTNARAVSQPHPALDARNDRGTYRFDRADVSIWLDARAVPAVVGGVIDDHSAALDTAIRAALSVLLPRRGALLLHSAGVVDRGRAFLFSGPSGAGKSTCASLTGVPDVLSDDLVALGPGAVAHAVPFTGLAEPRTSPLSAPVEVLCLLAKGAEHRLEPVEPSRAAGHFLRNVVHLPTGDPATADVLRIACDLALAIPLRRLVFRPDPGFWPALRATGGRAIAGPVSLDRPPGADYHGETR